MKLIAKKIEYSLTKPLKGKGGFQDYSTNK